MAAPDVYPDKCDVVLVEVDPENPNIQCSRTDQTTSRHTYVGLYAGEIHSARVAFDVENEIWFLDAVNCDLAIDELEKLWRLEPVPV